MFYWTVGRSQIVLTDGEELELLHDVGSTAEDRVGYMCDREDRRRLEKKMGSYLRQMARRDPEQFHRRFLDRRGVGPAALSMLRVLVEAYARTTRRALWGLVEDFDSADRIAAATWLKGEWSAVTILDRRLLQRYRSLRPAAIVAFPNDHLEKVTGTPQEFLMITRTLSVRFSPDRVRVFAREELVEPPVRSGSVSTST